MLRYYNRIRIYSGNKAREKFTFMNFALLIIEFETPIFSGIEPTRRFRGRQATLRPFPSLFFFFFYRQIKVLSFFVPHTIHVNDLLWFWLAHTERKRADCAAPRKFENFHRVSGLTFFDSLTIWRWHIAKVAWNFFKVLLGKS